MNRNPELIYDRSGETPGTVASTSGERERNLARMEKPPTDDVCPICFGNFEVPCRAPCGHWYCGTCILQYWNFTAALQPCKCPMCSQHIMMLTPEASLCHSREAETSKVLRNVDDYNRLFLGGISGFMLKVLASPLYIKRMLREMLNLDRLDSPWSPLLICFFDYLPIGRERIIDLLDYSAIAISVIFYLVGLYLRWKRARNIRELVEMQEGHD